MENAAQSDPQSQDSQGRIRDLEKQYGRIRVMMFGMAVLWLATLALVFGIKSGKKPDSSLIQNGILKVRGLLVEDSNGITRLQIGAPLPDPSILGKRINRGGTAHGILIFDAEGNERGGYVTFDETGLAMLSLDEIGRMVFRVSALPFPVGATLLMRDGFSNEATLSTHKEGPYLRLRRGDESILYQLDREATK